jgi:hypothetical protein
VAEAVQEVSGSMGCLPQALVSLKGRRRALEEGFDVLQRAVEEAR